MIKLCLFLCIFYVIGLKAGPASFIKPCIWNDKKCILESSKAALPYFVKGIPELNVSSFDPIYIKEMNADLGGLNLQLKDMNIRGAAKSVLINVERPDPDQTIILEFECPIVLTGKYKATGKFFDVDVYGEGETEIKTNKIWFKVDAKLKEFEKNGNKYFKISSFDYTYDPIEQVSYEFTNLYNGDKKKAQVLLDLINQNWKDILLENAKSIVKEIIKEVVSKINQFFLLTPIDVLEISKH